MKFKYYNSWYLRYYYNVFSAQAKFFFDYVFQQTGAKKPEKQDKEKIQKIPIDIVDNFLDQETEITRVNNNPKIDLSTIETIEDLELKFNEINQKFPSQKEYDQDTLDGLKTNLYEYIDRRNSITTPMQSISPSGRNVSSNQTINQFIKTWENSDNFEFSK